MKKRIDKHIEFHKSIDGHKSDVAFLEEVKLYIEELESIISFIKCDPVELPNEIDTVDKLLAWANDVVYCSCMNKP